MSIMLPAAPTKPPVKAVVKYPLFVGAAMVTATVGAGVGDEKGVDGPAVGVEVTTA